MELFPAPSGQAQPPRTHTFALCTYAVTRALR
jgi:hypothetical protein